MYKSYQSFAKSTEVQPEVKENFQHQFNQPTANSKHFLCLIYSLNAFKFFAIRTINLLRQSDFVYLNLINGNAFYMLNFWVRFGSVFMVF